MNPPKIFKIILNLFSNREEINSIQHSFDEEYSYLDETIGKHKANNWYRKQVAKSVPRLLLNSFYWGVIMLKSYFITALRNIKKYKGYSFINITGLAVGLTCGLLIFLFVNHELSYDKYHTNSERIYRLNLHASFGGEILHFSGVAAPTASALKQDYPEVENTARIYPKNNWYVKYENKTFKEAKVAFADPSLLNIFDIPLTAGNKEEILAAPYTIIISESTSQKYFGNDNPIGKLVLLNDGDGYRVTGVFEDIPGNNHFHYDLIASLSSNEDSRDKQWLNNLRFFTYVLLNPHTNVGNLGFKIQGMLQKYIYNEYDVSEEFSSYANFTLQPLTSIHLHSESYEELEANSSMALVYTFIAIGVFIILLAAVNFINLTTARSGTRAKEVGIRKTLGSHKSQLIKQILTETITLCFFALILALIIVSILLPSFSTLISRHLTLTDFLTIGNILAIFSFTFLIGILAGIYPAFVLSSFNPVKVLSQKISSNGKGSWMRHSLIVFQFAISVIFITGTLVVKEQLEYIQNKKVGFNKEHILIINDSHRIDSQIFSFKKQLLNNTNIISASISGFLPVNSESSLDVMCPDGLFRNDGTPVRKWRVDFDYVKTMGMEICRGRDFSEDHPSDSACVIINQAAVKQFGWDNPIGKFIHEDEIGGDDKGKYKVIGVVKDFNFESLHNNITPVGLFAYRTNRKLIAVRISPDNINATVSFIKTKWNEFTGEQPFEYSFMDERFDAMYKSEMKLADAMSIFSTIALFIGCLGLFGLASFMVEQRKKEIGMRKVLGASVNQIFTMLSNDFLKHVVISNIIAWPAAYYLVNIWLQDFAYRMELQLDIFIYAGLLSIILALATVSYKSIRAASANPINSIKYE